MQILVRTDKNVSGREAVTSYIEGVINASLSRFGTHLTRVEAYLSDENGQGKAGGKDIRCVLEAKIQGRQPVAVSNDAGTVHDAVQGAASKMESVLSTAIDKLKHM